jgi:3-deoxy-D-manno-octulosonic-acid transferase
VVLAALAERAAVEGRPLETVFTHFSPSAEALAASMPVDVAAYLPWDVPSAVGPVLDALHPDLVVFTKTEVWPVMSREARRRGIPTALVAATLPEGSSRLRWPTREVLRPSVRRLASVLAIGEEDAARFRRLGAHDERVYVTGDPAIDSAVQRAGQANPDATYLRPFREYGREHGRPTVVAGSTWPADEAVLLPACARVRAFVEDVRLIVAPHEPTGSHVAALERRLALDGWRVGRLGDVEAAGTAEDVDAVVVDRVGVLAHLYTVADVAYVGGGFHGAGLHSVLEPAAAGVPVAFGPRHGNAPAAAELVGAGGAVRVDGPDDLTDTLARWLGDDAKRRGTGRAASGYIDAHRGAAVRTAERLLDLL